VTPTERDVAGAPDAGVGHDHGHGTAVPAAEAAEEIVASFAEADRHDHVDLGGYGLEGWITVGFFWLMTAFVFTQFFTRYVLNDSFSWTEELAVYCLMPVVFIGAAMCVKRSRHIHVNFLYRYLPQRAGRVASTAVDLLCIAFFAYAAWLIARFALVVDNEPMTTLPWNKSYVYWLAFAGMAGMAVRAVEGAIVHWRQGYSILERPEAYD
jgi:TRAP-type C4-dicarboxylate transport system permease small subunit